MRRAPALLIASTFAASALASGPGAQPPTPPPPPPPATPEPPPAPSAVAIPVPDGPVIHKEEREGIVVEDIKLGDGYEVKPGGAVVAHYHGTLKDGGKEFDSSFKRGEPIAFPLSGVIPGWQKGVPGMKIGGIRRLTIPAPLAYGAQSPSPDIPANSDLVFIIQLVDALQIEDTKVGEGEEASGQCVAVTAYSIKDKDGKEIEKADASKPYVWLPGEFQAIQYGIEGMKVGGHRKLTVPKEMNVSPPQANATRPPDVPLTIDLDLIALRNLPQQRRH